METFILNIILLILFIYGELELSKVIIGEYYLLVFVILDEKTIENFLTISFRGEKREKGLPK